MGEGGVEECYYGVSVEVVRKWKKVCWHVGRCGEV